MLEKIDITEAMRNTKILIFVKREHEIFFRDGQRRRWTEVRNKPDAGHYYFTII